jgi:hypothetical protein
MTVWIAQCLCPDRHCIVAAADEAESRMAAEYILQVLRRQVTDLVKNGTLNPYCGICEAPSAQWHYEVARTRFETLANAMPELRETEAENLVAAAVWRQRQK